MGNNDFIKMVKDSQNRIRSMALVHDKLYRSQNFSSINFSDYARSLAIHLFQSNQVDSNLVQLKTNLEDVFLDIQTAIPCGLILNELITNSLKHAFPDGRGGDITVELHHIKNHTFQIIIRDNGVGIPEDLDIGHTKSMGLQIVTMLVNQLDGTLEVQREAGTTVQVVFKELKYKSRL
jgi:two-component sensor histidine kinase